MQANFTYRISIIAFFLFFIVPTTSLAQQNKDKKKAEAVSDLALPDDVIFNIYDFKNINRITEYYDKNKLEKIRELDINRDWEKLYAKLKDYIKNFGVQNFYKDTYWIWRLAKLTELYDDVDLAKSLYRLVLRHHHKGIDLREIELYYDSLNNQEANIYVPLDYYYELVEYRKAIDTLRPPRGVLLNMGPAINSRQADYGPSLSIDKKRLIFTSKRTEDNRKLQPTYNEDLYFSVFEEGRWSDSQPLRDINTIYNEGSACQSKDGNTLYFSRCDSPDGFGSCDLFMATKQPNGSWGNIQNLGANINSIGWDSHPSLSHDEDTLYFASDRIGGFGLSDIYFATKNKSGQWNPAQNIGPVINTRQNEVSPFFHPQHNILYFSSNGQLYNFGEFDIYKTYLIDGKWTEPKNIGPLVNGRGSEFYFTIDAESENLFYARSITRDLDKLDLYSFPLPMEAQPGATTRITGSLKDSISGDPFRGIVSIIDMDQGIEVAPRFLNSEGGFEFDLINNRNYLLVIQGDDFFRIEEMFFLNGPMEFNKLTQPIMSRLKFASIEFENGLADLQSPMYGDLNKIVNFLYDNPDFRLKVAGHTDSDGSAAFNLKLSKQRAQNIRDYIVIFGGIEPERVEYEGYGSTMPLVEETSPEAKTLNRRVEFEIFRPSNR